MTKVQHRFLKHRINTEVETLIIGTFNPDTKENIADFFYGRPRNFLWQLMPLAMNESSLKGKSKELKMSFIKKYKIDFIDLISEVDVDEVDNYDDNYLDSRVSQWREIVEEIVQLQSLKRIGLTRKSFVGIPYMKGKIEEIKTYCEEKGIKFQCLTTPARFYHIDKQKEWSDFFNNIEYNDKNSIS